MFLVIKHRDGWGMEVLKEFEDYEEAHQYVHDNSIDEFGNLTEEEGCPYLNAVQVRTDPFVNGWHKGTNGYWYGSKNQKSAR